MDTLPKDFATKRKIFFASFAAGHHSAFLPHLKKGEVLGPIQHGPRAPGTPKHNPEIWRNVSEHCLVAGSIAALIAEKLQLSPDSIRLVIEAAILHDWYKKCETVARRTATTLEEISAVWAATPVQEKVILTDLGYSDEVISLCHANSPELYGEPQTIEEKIIFLTDAILLDETPLNLLARFYQTENHPERGADNRAFSESYCGRMPIPEESLYEHHKRLGREIAAEIGPLMGYYEDPDFLGSYLRSLLIQKILAIEIK